MQAASTEKGIGEEDQDNEDLCVVCWETGREVIFYNCMHMVRPCNSEAAHV